MNAQLEWGAYKLDDVGRFSVGDIRVYTSKMLLTDTYETLVTGPADLLVWLGGDTWEYGTSRGDAEAGFTTTVARIHQYLADRKVA
jgi:hypothetical protein